MGITPKAEDIPINAKYTNKMEDSLWCVYCVHYTRKQLYQPLPLIHSINVIIATIPHNQLEFIEHLTLHSGLLLLTYREAAVKSYVQYTGSR